MSAKVTKAHQQEAQLRAAASRLYLAVLTDTPASQTDINTARTALEALIEMALEGKP